MVSRCDICNDILSANNRLNSDLNFGNGSQFNDGYTVCYDCGRIIKNILDELIKLKKGYD
jgi:hypothetical protein